MDMMQPEQEAPEQSGFTVCIRVEGDKFKVGIEGPEETQEYADFEEFSTVKEALTKALELIKGGGSQEAAEEESFNEGYTNRMPTNG